jgi:competence ComEA-like helix-hairpin-helix protein
MFDLTPTEKRAITVLVLVIGSAGLVQLIRPMVIRSDFYDYSAADSVFQRTSEIYLTPEGDSSRLSGRQESKPGSQGITSFPHQKNKQRPEPLPAQGSLDLNRASVAELERLPHIGPALAKRIVTFREKNGKFISLRELKKVKGIGDKTFELIKPYLQEVK